MTTITWKTDLSGDWSLGSNWIGNAAPTSANQVLIAATGTPYTVTISVPEAANALTLSSVAATLQVDSILTMGGALTLTAGTLDLIDTIKGGSLILNGGSFIPGGGTLDAVKLQGALSLTQSFGSPLVIKDGLKLTNAAGTGAGLISLTGQGASLHFASGVQTLTSAVAGQATSVFIGSGAGDSIVEQNSGGTITTATLGAPVTVNQVGQFATLTASTQAGDSLVNQGFIKAALAGGTFAINGGSFVNTGTITASAGDTVSILSSNFHNTGTINVFNTGTLNIGQNGTWSSTGAIAEIDATVNLMGTVSLAEIHAITTRTGGLVDLAGTLNLAGGTLSVGAGTTIGDLLVTGTIAGGTIHDPGLGIQFGTGSFPNPTLSGITYQGVLDLSEPSARVNVQGAFTLTGTAGTGAGVINLTGSNANLSMTGSRTLDNATMRIGPASMNIVDNPGTASVVTFGTHLAILQAGVAFSQFSNLSSSINGGFGAGDSLLNQGAISGSLQNGVFNIQGFATITNAGAINFTNGDNVSVSAFGTLINQSTIALGNGDGANLVGSTAFSNTGLISSGFGDSISISAGTVANTGTMSIGSGSTLTINGFSSFANAGGITLAAGSTLNIGSSTAAWSSSTKTLANAATVNLDGIVTQAQIGDITRTNGGVIDIVGTLNDTAAPTTLSVGTGSVFGALELSGAIIGGIIHDGGAGLTFVGPQFGTPPTLSAVTYQGTVDLSEANARVNVVGGITFSGTAGTGAGTVNLTGAGAQLQITGTTVLDNATIDFGAPKTTSFAAGATLEVASNFSGSPVLLTLGSRLVVQQTGALAAIEGSTAFTDVLINRGTVNAGVSGGTLTLSGNQFNNLGVVNVSNGDFLELEASSFTNAGTVNVTTGGTLAVGLNGDWISTGHVNENNGTVLLQGDVTLPEISAITRTGGTLVIAGRYNNRGATLNVGTGSALGNFVLTGTIDNGTVHDAGGGIVMQGGTLDSVIYKGVVDLSASGAALTVLGSLFATDLTGTLPGLIKLTGAGSVLTLQEPQTLNNATIDIGNTVQDIIAVTQPFFFSSGWTTTLGSKLLVQQTGTLAEITAANVGTADTVLNAGTIRAGFAGGVFTINGQNFANSGTIAVSAGDTMDLFAARFTNTGTVTITTGGVLNLGTTAFFGTPPSWTSTGVLSETNGTINLGGSLTLANLNSIKRSGGLITMSNTADLGGGTLNVGTGSVLGALTVSGTIQDGTVHDAGHGLSFGGGALSNVSYRGTLDLSQPGAQLNITGPVTFAGLTGAGRATILLTGPLAQMSLQGTETLDNANLSLGGAQLNATPFGSQFGSQIPGNLTLGANLTISHTLASSGVAGTAQIASTGSFVGSNIGVGGITNLGVINAGLAGGFLTISGASFSNAGHIVAFATDTVTMSANTLSNTGVIAVNNATMTIGASTQTGNGTSNFNNTGSLTITGGGTLNLGPASFASQFTWSNTGTLSETGSTINLNGPVTLANLLSITRTAGTITLAGTADLGGGTLNVGGGTTLHTGGSTASLGALVVTGAIQNGTINDADPGIVFQGFSAKLNNVTYHGTMDMSPANSVVTVSGGLPLAGLGGVGAGTILLTGAGSMINMAGTETLGNALLDIGNGAQLLAVNSGSVSGGGAPQMTLAGNFRVVHTGGNAIIGGGSVSFGSTPATIINNGSVSALAAGGLFSINGNSFVNGGVINVGSSDTMSINAATFSNTGSLLVTTGGVLNLGQAFGTGTWSNTGKLNETGATINLFSTVTLANLNSITRSGGTINFQGTLNGAGGILKVGTGSTLGTVQDTGTIAATIIQDPGNGLLYFGPSASSVATGAVLNADTYQGTMNLSSTLARVTVSGGLISTGAGGTGAGLVNLTGAGAVLFAQDTETFNNMQINIGNAAPLGSTLFQTDHTALGAVLTFGSGMVINQTGINANILGARNLGDMIVNNGKIFANVAGGQFLITQGAFTNAGSIVVGAGATLGLTMDSNFVSTGLLQLAGGTVVTPVIANSGKVIGNGTVNGQLNGTGSIEASGATLLFDFQVQGNASQIDAGAILQVNGAMSGGSATFASTASGILALGNPAGSSTVKINGFAGSDKIDLLGKAVTGLSYNATTKVLTVTNGAATVATLTIDGTYTTPNFGHVSDNNGGTFITFVPGGGGGGGSGIIVPLNASMIGAASMQFIAPQPTVNAAAGHQTLLLPGIGGAMETVTGFALDNGDVLNLRNAMLGSAWNGDPSLIGNFVNVSQSGANSFVNVAPTGHGAGSTIAMLAGVDTSLAALTAHHAISYG